MALTRRKSEGEPPSAQDEQVREMVADPGRYFAKARAEARREARTYVANHRVKTA